VAPLILVAALALDPVAQWRPQIEAASARCGVPAAWIVRVMRAESGGRTHRGGRPIRSVKGAMGLMQLMPGTWAELRRDLALGSDPDLPADNIIAGACYLRRMYDRFGYPGLFGAYHAGPGRYAGRLAGRPLPPETIAYLAAVGGQPRQAEARVMPPVTLFAVRRSVPAGDGAGPTEPPVDPLFAVRNDDR